MTQIDTDVLIVGYGPVGQTTAALLARQGHRVEVYERFADLYDLPRAVYFDDEIMQVWQALGVAGELDVLPVSTYHWFGADGEPILRMEHPAVGPSGWDAGYMFYQPALERALDRAVQALPSAAIHHGWSAEAVEQHDDHVAVTLRRVNEPRTGRLEPTDELRTIRARYVIGADGANSLVRQAAGIGFHDQGFAEQWLVVDLRPDDIDALSYIPAPCQWCDPARLHMHTRNGLTHRRFEFMLLPGERPEDVADEARVWGLLAPWFTPADGALVRHAVYEFRARLADTMHAGRVLLAGDAAHTMPPFMGQGMCSGVRDAAGLAWRLDLILRGLAGDRLLDAYTRERQPQDEWIVALSTEMGRVSCTLDPQAAAERDATLRAAEAPPALGLPPLQDGSVARDRRLAGTRAVQGLVRLGDRDGRCDDVLGTAFALLSRRPAELAPEQAEHLARLGVVVIDLEKLEDLDGRLTAWFDAHDIAAVLVRPDAYVFGAAQSHADVPALVDDLRSHLSTTESKVTADV
jgi:2-polyprenyl-6-methoxyphenol hydroxylase-like FAD-dependent oxidoreductase